MDANNITDNNNIMDTNITNIKSIKKKHSFKKKKKARPILSQHGGAKYDFDNLIGIDTARTQPCWFNSVIQLLWNIDCLRDYLLKTDENVIRELNAMTEVKKKEEEDKEKERINKLLDNKMSKTSTSSDAIPPIFLKPDTIDTKIKMILALKSILKVYEESIVRIKSIDSATKTKLFAGTRDGDLVTEFRKNKLAAELNNNITFKGTDNKDYSSISTIFDYIAHKTILDEAHIPDPDSQQDPLDFILLIFILFEDIDDAKIIDLKKCFTCRTLNINGTDYTISPINSIAISNPPKRYNFQNIIDRDYFESTNKRLILFPETKFILLTDYNTDTTKFERTISTNINISNHTYILRGCIIHIYTYKTDQATKERIRSSEAGHELFVAYDNIGNKAALLNDIVKSDLNAVKDIKEHSSNQTDNDPTINGTIFLYELDDPAKIADADNAKIATTLGAAIAAVGEADTSQPDTNVAAALTATLAAAVPDTSSTKNVPAALISTVAATQLPAPTQPTKHDKSVKSVKSDIKPSGSSGNGSSGNGSSSGDNDPNRQRSLASGARERERDREKPLVKEQVEVKPYSGSLEPSSDSNGENMVLGILLVITLAISGVLFVQH